MPVNYTVWEKILTPGLNPPSIDFSFVPLHRVEMPTPSQLSEAAGSTYRFFSGNCNANEVLQRQISHPEREAMSSVGCLSSGWSNGW